MTVGEGIDLLLDNLARLEQTTGRDAGKAIQELAKLRQSLTEGQLNTPLEELPEKEKEVVEKEEET